MFSSSTTSFSAPRSWVRGSDRFYKVGVLNGITMHWKLQISSSSSSARLGNYYSLLSNFTTEPNPICHYLCHISVITRRTFSSCNLLIFFNCWPTGSLNSSWQWDSLKTFIASSSSNLFPPPELREIATSLDKSPSHSNEREFMVQFRSKSKSRWWI